METAAQQLNHQHSFEEESFKTIKFVVGRKRTPINIKLLPGLSFRLLGYDGSIATHTLLSMLANNFPLEHGTQIFGSPSINSSDC